MKPMNTPVPSPGASLGNRRPIPVVDLWRNPPTKTSPGSRLAPVVRTLRPGMMKRSGRWLPATSLA